MKFFPRISLKQKFFNFQINTEKIIEFEIYALVFFLPWQTRWIIKSGEINGGPSEFLTYSLYATDVLLIALLALVLIYLRKRINTSIHLCIDALKRGEIFTKKNIAENIGVGILITFLFLGLISIFWAENKWLAVFVEIKLFLAVAFFLLIDYFAQKVRLAFSFVLGMIGPAILAIWQFQMQQTIAFKWLGLAEHQASTGGTSVIETYANGIVFERWLRAYGSFDHPNILGGGLAIGILVVLWLLIRAQKETRHSRMTGENKKIMHMIFVYASLVILATGLFVSFSRSAWLALFLGMITGSLVLFFQKRFFDLKIWIFGVVIVSIVFAVMFAKYQSLVDVRTQGEVRLEKLSVDQRKIYLEQAGELIKDSTTAGVGIGNYISALERLYSNKPVWEYQPVHNVPVLVFAELGIFGVILFACWFGNMLWRYGRKNFLALALLIALLPMMFLDHWLWSLHFGILFMAVATGLVVGFSEKEKV